MSIDNWNERWMPVVFDFEFTNQSRLEVSNFGRVRTFNKVSDGRILNGSITEGYKVIRLKFFKPRSAEKQTELDELQQAVFALARTLKEYRKNDHPFSVIEKTEKLLEQKKEILKKKFAQDTRKRTINHHELIHRLVAEYFVPKTSKDQTVVSHMDYDKMNNRAGNLQWMTPEENRQHQNNSPYVIAEKLQRKGQKTGVKNNAKLTETRVMLLKKLINEGKPMKQLVKLFKVTETQIIRIKKGENWGATPAAK